MYNFRHDRSKDRILFEIIYENKFEEEMQLLTVVREIYTEHEMYESLKEIEKDFDEYWAEFNRLKKEKGMKFKYQDVADNLPNNTWPGIVKENIKRDPNGPGSIPLNELPKEELEMDIERLSEKILRWEAEHKIQ
jgi:hypothetical protein